jgi:hypothetical protein
MRYGTKKYWKHQIIESIQNNNKAAVKALKIILSHQTTAEQFMGDVQDHNNEGFRPCDAKIMTSMAKFYDRKGYLTPKQITIVKDRMVHYHRQLLEHAVKNGKITLGGLK